MNHDRYVKEILHPVVYYTFDSDTLWDKDSKLLSHGWDIPDDSGSNPPIIGTMTSDYSDTNPSYVLGQPSLISTRVGDNYSIKFAPNSRDTENTFYWTKSIIEIPDNNIISMSGDWTIAFMVKIDYRNIWGELNNYIWDTVKGKYVLYSSTNSARTKTILWQKGDYKLYYDINGSLTLEFNGNKIQTSNYVITPKQSLYIVSSLEVTRLQDGRYFTTTKLFVNNLLVGTYKTNPIYGKYKAGNTSSFYIAGNQDPTTLNALDDRCIVPTIYDQFQIYNYCLTEVTISNLYKKAFTFDQIITQSNPVYHFAFNEVFGDKSLYYYSYTNNSSTPNGWLKNPNESYDKIKNGIEGVQGIYGGTAIQLNQGAMLYSKPYSEVNSGGYYSYTSTTFFSPSNDYTIEFFMSFTGNDKGVLFALQDEESPFKGLLIEANVEHGKVKSGVLQFNIDQNTYINTEAYDVAGNRIYYNDGVVRHYSIIKKDNIIKFYINSSLIGELSDIDSFSNTVNRLYLFGLAPGDLYMGGTIQHLLFYNRALSDREISVHANYISEYIIQGKVTIQGVGQRVLLRIYSFSSGELLFSQYSDTNGIYRIRVPNDDLFNMVALDPTDTNIRPRTVGPISADKYLDIP